VPFGRATAPRCFEIESSSERRPRSLRTISAVAVNVFVSDATPYGVAAVDGVRRALSANPNPSLQMMRPSRAIATAIEGARPAASASSIRARRSSSDRRCAVVPVTAIAAHTKAAASADLPVVISEKSSIGVGIWP
jgi:hypothetical protein